MLALLTTGLLTLGVGWFLGMWTRKYIWPTCPEDSCGRALRCPIHEASDIRSDQAAAGPRPDRLAR